MANLEWHEVGKYDKKIMWNKQNLNLPELGQDVLIFFPNNDPVCRKYSGVNGNPETIFSDEHGRVIAGYFYLTEHETEIAVTDGFYTYGYIRDGIKWAEYNRPSQLDRQVKLCENFICKKYDMRSESRCSKIPCGECSDGNCVNCKKYLSKSPKCKNCKVW